MALRFLTPRFPIFQGRQFDVNIQTNPEKLMVSFNLSISQNQSTQGDVFRPTKMIFRYSVNGDKNFKFVKKYCTYELPFFSFVDIRWKHDWIQITWLIYCNFTLLYSWRIDWNKKIFRTGLNRTMVFLTTGPSSSVSPLI